MRMNIGKQWTADLARFTLTRLFDAVEVMPREFLVELHEMLCELDANVRRLIDAPPRPRPRKRSA
jgi:hypothetical protein